MARAIALCSGAGVHTLGGMNPTTQLLVPEVRGLIGEARYRELRDALRGLDPPDVADLLSELEPQEATVAFRILPRDFASEAFSELDAETQEELIHELGEERALRLVESLDPDDRVALLDELPPSVARRLLDRLSPQNQRVTRQMMGYAEESVGRLMTPDYVRVRRHWTVGKALEHVRRYGKDAETVHWVFVIDEQGRLIDDLHIRKILLADPSATIESLMDDRFLALSASDDQEDAVRMMNRYDRSALPVVDSRGVLLGIVTYDDMADIAEAEATEDIHKLAGVEVLDRSYTQTGIREMLRKRGGVLGTLFAAQTLTIAVVGAFEERIASIAVLIAFIPLIIASGGNTGTQTASLLVRALSLEEVAPSDWKGVLLKELLTALGLGLVLGCLGFLSVQLYALTPLIETDMPLRIGLTVGISIMAIVVWAVLIGAMFPLLLERVGLDPATISSPLVATMMDVSGLIIYAGAVTLVLGGLM